MLDCAGIAGRTATEIGRLMREGAACPVALTEHLLARIAAHPDRAVFITVTAERARAEAAAAKARLEAGRPASALDGVPVVHKDLVDLAGTVTTAGSDLYRHAPPAERDAPVAARMAAAGLVCLGKVNLSEFAYSGLGLNPHFGTPRNPHGRDAHRAPGGSSSGSAVAVAAGLAPCALGTDTGGSIRVPAALNGIVGLKTTEGRIDKSGVFPLSETLDTVGPLGRSVMDCVLLDMAMRGAPETPVRRADPREVEIVVAENVVLDDLEPEVAANFERALSRLSQAGMTVRAIRSEALQIAADITAAHGTITAAEAYHHHRAVIDGPDAARVDPRVVARILGGKRMSANDMIAIARGRARAIAALAAELGRGALAMPATPHVAPEVAPLEADEALFHRVNLKTLRNTVLGNFLRSCGLVIPNGTGAAGMPTGLLLTMPGDADERLMSLGLTVERALAG
ncbi:MAG: hypothetical protein KatS3mg118_3289 [Paracoccaceae bacterium]|nr:MAG: hypothetical protein KatS3mg118_3289 [Paracoccaceae bacterium]